MKYKKIPKEYIKICLDRLTRFKPVYEKYERVLGDIANKFLISKPENQSCAFMSAISAFNESIPYDFDPFVSNLLYQEEKKNFYIQKDKADILESWFNKLNLTGAIKYISDISDLPLNLKRLAVLEKDRDINPLTLRKEAAFLFPVSGVVLTEGATEEILLSEFAKKTGYDFNKEGIFLLGAGGKNQVARKYYKMVEEIKLPIFVLLDFDAKETEDLILPKLRPCDKIYLIKTGEFEDILPQNLIIKALNLNFANGLKCSSGDFNHDEKMTKNLHNLFKNKGFGEYKKAEFAKMVKRCLKKIGRAHV